MTEEKEKGGNHDIAKENLKYLHMYFSREFLMRGNLSRVVIIRISCCYYYNFAHYI